MPGKMRVLLNFAATGEVSTCVVSPGQRREYITELAKRSTKFKRWGPRSVSPTVPQKRAYLSSMILLAFPILLSIVS
jgi:hypothetical protein